MTSQILKIIVYIQRIYYFVGKSICHKFNLSVRIDVELLITESLCPSFRQCTKVNFAVSIAALSFQNDQDILFKNI